jgi:hypothetical protein
MSYQEKSNIVSLITTLIVSIPYYVYVFAKYQSEALSTPEAFKFWAAAILFLIPIRIVTEIIIHILSAILEAVMSKEEKPDVTDERDQLISLKSTRNSYYVFMIAFVASIAALYLDNKAETMFITLIIGGFMAELMEHASQIFYYRRGF